MLPLTLRGDFDSLYKILNYFEVGHLYDCKLNVT